MSFEITYDVAVNAIFISAFFLLAKSMPLIVWRIAVVNVELFGLGLSRPGKASLRDLADKILKDVPEDVDDTRFHFHLYDRKWRDLMQNRDLISEAGIATFLLVVLLLNGFYSVALEGFMTLTVVLLTIAILWFYHLNHKYFEVIREVRHELRMREEALRAR